MPARCVIHSVNCAAEMKQHPLVPEKPGCRGALAVLSSEMLAGDRKALFPRSWLGPRTPLMYDATTQEHDAIQIPIALQGSVLIILYGWPADAEHTDTALEFRESKFLASFIFETSQLSNSPSQLSGFRL
jgi:hypothetical protein